MVNSINSNIAAQYAQVNIGIASNNVSSSVARLSSGNRIVKASDDVTALSIGTSFRTQVSTLKVAKLNVSLGTSLLQVADGALAQATELLQRMKAIAAQAGSGSLTNTERGYLDQEFQALVSEVDRVAGNANFNGVKLLDGALSEAASLSVTSTNATAGSLQISFANQIVDAETVIINGVTVTAETGSVGGLEFAVGNTLAETVQNLAARLNTIAEDNSLVDGTNITHANKLALSQAKYEANGTTLVITSRTGGVLSDSFRVSTLGTATVNNESSFAGRFSETSFNLFGVTTSWTSANTVVSNDTAAAATPFQNADSIVALVNGVATTLFTLTDNLGTGNASGDYSLQDIVNGINGNKDTTGFGASLVYNGSTYNIRLSYSGLSSNVLIKVGDNYHSGTYTLNGANIDYSDSDSSAATDDILSDATIEQVEGSSGNDLRLALFYTGYVTAVDPGDIITAASISATVTAASPSADSAPFREGDNLTVTVNGSTHVLHTFAANDGLDDIVQSINGKSANTGVYATITGTASNYNIKLYLTDPSAGTVAVSAGAGLYTGGSIAANGATSVTTTGATLSQTTSSGLRGGADDGIGLTNVVGSGTTGDEILTDFSSTKSEVQLVFTQNAAANETIVVGGQTFYFTSNTTRAPNEILIGADLKESLDNAVDAIQTYLNDGYALGTAAFELNQIDISREGNNLIFRSKKVETVSTITGGTSTVNTTVTGASRTNSGNLSNAATTFGVKVDGVANHDFLGTIQGFQATYTGTTDQVDLEITIGDFTYSAENVDITVTSNTTIRFLSNTLADGSNGGYFDVQLRANEILSVANQTAADLVASRLDAAFSSLDFVQKRNVDSYTGSSSISVDSTVIGSLFGTSVRAQLSNFDDLDITDISVSAPQGSSTDAKISLTIGGVVYSSTSGLTDRLGGNQVYKFLSSEDPNQFIEFVTGDTAIELDTDEKAAAVESALRAAFGANSGSAALSFQVGTTTADELAVSIENVTSDALFKGATLNVLTQAAAQTASAAIDIAIRTVTAVRADVGALQSRFNYAAANIESSIQNQDAARGELLDTDIAAESTSFATAQVKLQAGISVLAQSNQQLQALLKLIG